MISQASFTVSREEGNQHLERRWIPEVLGSRMRWVPHMIHGSGSTQRLRVLETHIKAGRIS